MQLKRVTNGDRGRPVGKEILVASAMAPPGAGASSVWSPPTPWAEWDPKDLQTSVHLLGGILLPRMTGLSLQITRGGDFLCDAGSASPPRDGPARPPL
ncbi:hypothetical protein M885DRAFT_523116 [Pelagophyceae sp. CCMP2097]|nr:hypothetical protein M885DRAFT_523116 [Pelagophyceae sp. CCMP2097]